MSGRVSVHIFEPMVKKLGFNIFKCTKDPKIDCYNNCSRRDRCPVNSYQREKTRDRWLGVFMGETAIGVLTIDDNRMVRFRSAGNNLGLNSGAKIGDIVDPKTIDKIGRRILKTASKRVPIEIRREVGFMGGTLDHTCYELTDMVDRLERFLADFRFTVKKWQGMEKVGEKTGVAVDVSVDVNLHYQNSDKDSELTLSKSSDLIQFIQIFSKFRATAQKVVELFDKISKEVV
jgi:hypothetical protein